MSTDIKPGQVWDYTTTDGSSALHEVRLVTESHVKIRYQDEPFGETTLRRGYFLKGRHLVKPADTTPAPLDPHAVKPGDTVTLTRRGATLTDKVYEVGNRGIELDNLDDPLQIGMDHWTLTDHQPAPEPEPEWKPRTVAEATVKGRFGRVRVMRLHETPTDKTHHWVEESGTIPDDSHVTNIRPLVVLDPTTARKAVVDALAENLSDDVNYEGLSKTTDAVVAALGIEAAS